VHPDRACIDAAVTRKAFGRALRTAITTVSVDDISDLGRWAESQMDK
jgi:predicted RNA-binding protein YlxR (DUF448 family)